MSSATVNTYTPHATILQTHRMNSKPVNYRQFEEKEHAELYAKYRHSYPKQVYETIKKYCQQSDNNELTLAIDVGCGSGQSTLPLVNICKHVIGIDISREQIVEAKRSAGNIDFRVGQGEDLSFLGDGTVDLVTTATAVHWMDIPTFMGEVSRVLRPGGVIAVYSIGIDTIHNTEAHKLVWENFYNKTLGNYWAIAKIHIENGLGMVELPFVDSTRMEPLLVKRKVVIDSYIGLLSTWSAWRRFQERNPETNALGELRTRLRTLYTDDTSGEVRQIDLTTPIYMLLGRK